MTLGEILHMGSATVGPVDQNQKDRHFVLFSSTLLILSVSARMSGFIYEVRQREIKLGSQYLYIYNIRTVGS